MTTLFRLRATWWWSIGRWLVLGTALFALWACTARTFESPQHCPSQVYTKRIDMTVNRQLDLLFMVDNSQSMSKLQTKLLDPQAGFPIFMDILKNIPVADGSGVALPDIHIAVISSNVGAGGLDLPRAGCPQWGDLGRFQTAPRDPCATSPLDPGQFFLAASNNQQVKNYTGDIADAFTCIAKLGESGCGFEGQLKSVRWALDPAQSPPEDQKFLRDDAYLGVVLITNEDDCSMPDDSSLMTLGDDHLDGALGPLLFRCNDRGHLCNIDGTLQPPPRQAASMLECVSNDDGDLISVADEVAFLKGLKTDPDKVLVAAITGPPTPYDVVMTDQNLFDGTVESEPTIAHSCVGSGGEFADPAVRIAQWVNGFGDHGLRLGICDDSFAPALSTIATKLGELLRPACVDASNIANRSSGSPNCVVDDRAKNDQGNVVETAVAACAENGNVPPCWSLEDDAHCSDGQKVLKVNRGAAAAPNDMHTDISCALAEIGAPTADAAAAPSGCPSP